MQKSTYKKLAGIGLSHLLAVNLVIFGLGNNPASGQSVNEFQSLVSAVRNEINPNPFNPLSTFYQDTDGDTYGNPLAPIQAISPPSGYVADSSDCNDTNAAIHPGAQEICGNLVDEDCDGGLDFAPPPGVALSFDGSNDYVQTTDFNLGTSDFTMELWINPGSSTVGYLITNRTVELDGAGNWFALVRLADGRINLELAESGVISSYSVITSIAATPVGSWSHISVSRSSTTIAMYINGVLQQTYNDSFVRNLTTGFNTGILGAWQFQNAHYFNGMMDEVRIWHVSRSACQISQSMSQHLSGPEAGLATWFDFNHPAVIPGGDNAGQTTLSDLASGNGLQHGTLNNFALTGSTSNWTDGFAPVNQTWYLADSDNDGYGDPASAVVAATPPCSALCVLGADCDDDNAAIHPGAQEICDDLDNDCDGGVDNVLMPGLKFYLPFSGNANDTSTFHHDGTVINATLTTGHTGTANSAYSLSGSNSYIQVADHSDLHPENFTVAVRFFYNAVPGGVEAILGKPICAGWADSYGIWMMNSALHVGWANGPTTMEYYSFPAPAPGAWHHVALTFDDANNQAKVYIDNVLAGTFTSSMTIAYDNTPLVLGCDYEYCSLAFFFNGKIDEPMLFNRPLSSSEISALYQSGPFLIKPTYYTDADGDFYGDSNDQGIQSCTPVAGKVTNHTDCDDNNAFIHPGATEICNGLDDNCDGMVDSLAMPGIQLYLPLNGNAHDLSANGLNGAIIGSVTPTADRFGNPNSAMSFPGNNESYIQISDHPVLRPASLTLAAWVKLNAQNYISTFVDKPINCVNDSWHFGTQNSEYSTWVSNSTNCGDLSQTTSPLTLNAWKHIVFTLDDLADTRKMYVDGSEVASGAYTSTIPYDGNPVLIGAAIENGSLAFPLNGDLDDILIFNRALTGAEIASLFAGTPIVSLTTSYYADADGDGHGDINDPGVQLCEQLPGMVTNHDDCDDNNASIHPGAPEICGNASDEDCNGVVSPCSNALHEPGSGNAISFDGVDDLIPIPNLAFDDFTIECWIKTTQTGSSPGGAAVIGTGILSSDLGTTSSNDFVPMALNGNFITFGTGDGGDNTITSTIPVNDGQWHHVAVTRNKNTAVKKIYIDGTENVSGTGSSLSYSANPFIYAGADFVDGAYFSGVLDEIRIWNAVLNHAQIRERMCRKITNTDSLYNNLVSYYNFDESSGNIAFDDTYNLHDATLFNDPLRVTSGAAIGNVSAYNYVTTGLPSAGLSFNGEDSLAVVLTAGTYTGEAGTHIYAVNETPNTTGGILGIGTNNRYFGVFHANLSAPVYDATYHYSGNPFVTAGNESALALYERPDNSFVTGSPWTNAGATLNMVANTLTLTGQNTEYMLGTDAPLIFFQDADADTYGNPLVTQTGFTPPAGYVSDNTDCDDTNAGIHPGAAEICNALDDDCDGLIDDGVAIPTANAGPDQTICISTATLMASSPNPGTGVWTKISGTGTIASPSNPATTVTGIGVGTSLFRWTITKDACTSFDDVAITNNGVPANASYRTKQNGDWNNASSWEVLTTCGWIDAVNYPASTNSDTVVVRSGHVISAFSASGKRVTVESGATLFVSSLAIANTPGIDLVCYGSMKITSQFGGPGCNFSFENSSSLELTSGDLRGTFEVKAGCDFKKTTGGVIYMISAEFNNYATFNVLGGSINMHLSTINNFGIINFNNTFQFTNNSGTTSAFINHATGVINKNNTFSLFLTAAPVTNSGTVNVYAGNLSISINSNAGTLKIYGGSLSIGTGTHSASSLIQVQTGGLLNAGTLTYQAATIHNDGIINSANLIMDATVSQVISGNGSISNLTMNNASGVVMNGTQTITGIFAMDLGLISLADNDINIGSTCTLTWNNLSYINTNGTGLCRMAVPGGNFVKSFPIGTTSGGSRTDVTGTSVGNDTISCRVSEGVFHQYDVNNNPAGAAITKSAVNKTWFIKRHNSASTLNASLFWKGADELTGFNRNSCRGGRFAGESWNLDSQRAAPGNSQYSITLTEITAFTPLGVFTSDVTCEHTYTTICSGSNVNVPYSAVGSFDVGNIFTAQLSDAGGSFSSPVNIGSVAATLTGTIAAAIPQITLTGAGYRIRIVSSSMLYNTINNNGSNIVVNQSTLFYNDLDNDGFGDITDAGTYLCSATAGKVSDHTDCNDTNPNIHPGATELCNGIDDDCDGSTDEEVVLPVITAGGATTFCPGGSVLLTSSLTENNLWSTGATTQSITVTAAGEYTVSSSQTLCTSLPVTVAHSPLPGSAGTISGSNQVFQGQTGVTYSVAEIPDATGYIWTLPPDAAITSGQNTRTIVVEFGPAASSGTMRVRGTNSCGSGTLSPVKTITVNMAPSLILGSITVNGTECYNATQTITVAGSGNTFLVKPGGSATMIAGVKINYLPGTKVLSGGYMLGKITTTGTYCGAKSLELVTEGSGDEQGEPGSEGSAIHAAAEVVAGSEPFRFFPNPTAGKVTLELRAEAPLSVPVKVEIINTHGERVLQTEFSGTRRHDISLSGLPSGIYFIRILHPTFIGSGKVIRL